METDEPMAAAPIAAPVKEKKGGKGAVIGMVFFMLVAIGLGVWVAILLLNPTKGGNGGSDSSSNNGADNSGTVTPATTVGKEEEVRDLVSDVIDSLDGGYRLNLKYDNSGLLVKISDELKTVTNLSYGATITVVTGANVNINSLYTGVINALTKKYSMISVTKEVVVGETEGSYQYYKNSDGLYCRVAPVGYINNGFYFDCTNEHWVTDEDKDLDIELAKVYNATEGKQYPTKYMDARMKNIKKNSSGTYETITASIADAVALFYRKVGGEWQFLTGTQQGVSCDKYNTAELKEAFEGQTCWDSQGNDVVIKR